MTYEESIHKMLEQILWNQREILNVLIGHDRGACCPHTLDCIKETEALIEQVKKPA